MKKKIEAVLLTVVLFVLIAVAVTLVYIKILKTPLVVAPVGLPTTVFDLTETIPGTHASFSYPSRGFYGLGNMFYRLTSDQKINPGLISGTKINPALPYVPEKGSEFVVLNVSLYENKSNLTPEDWVANFPDGVLDKVYAKSNGRLVTMGGHQFFIYKTTEGPTSWSAYATSKEGMVSVSLAYTSSESAESLRAYTYNDQLFLQIISHVEFE
jgi:hypothetical protein